MITAMARIALMLRDFETAISTFRDVFGISVIDFSDRIVPGLGAHVGMCVPKVAATSSSWHRQIPKSRSAKVCRSASIVVASAHTR